MKIEDYMIQIYHSNSEVQIDKDLIMKLCGLKTIDDAFYRSWAMINPIKK